MHSRVSAMVSYLAAVNELPKAKMREVFESVFDLVEMGVMAGVRVPIAGLHAREILPWLPARPARILRPSSPERDRRRPAASPRRAIAPGRGASRKKDGGAVIRRISDAAGYHVQAAAAVAHRAALVQNQVDAQVGLVLELLDVIAVGAGEQPPVEVAGIVAGRVRPVVDEVRSRDPERAENSAP
mgnify:CR=1 FL=1